MRLTATLSLLVALSACASEDPPAGGVYVPPGPVGLDSSMQPVAVAEPGKDGSLSDAGAQVPGKDGSVGAPPTGSDAATPASDASNPVGDGAVVGQPDGGGAGKPQLALSADFLAKTITIFDVGKLKEGAKRSDVQVAQINLSMFTPGPLALGVTPDGKTALVSVSASFLSYFTDVPAGAGTLVFVDLEKRAVLGELKTGNSPMGIVIPPDGKRAFVGHFSESYFSVVDIEKRTATRVSTGGSYNEEFGIDDTGTVAILTYGASGNAKTFSVADPGSMMGQTTGLTGDAAGTGFFPGTKMAFLLQAPTTLTGNQGGYNVVNVENPARPVVTDSKRGAAPTTYPVAVNHARKSIVYPATADGMLTIVEVKLEGEKAVEVQRAPAGPASSLAYGVTVTPDGRVLAAVPGDHHIVVVDLEAKKFFSVPWEQTVSGPVDIKMIP